MHSELFNRWSIVLHNLCNQPLNRLNEIICFLHIIIVCYPFKTGCCVITPMWSYTVSQQCHFSCKWLCKAWNVVVFQPYSAELKRKPCSLKKNLSKRNLNQLSREHLIKRTFVYHKYKKFLGCTVMIEPSKVPSILIDKCSMIVWYHLLIKPKHKVSGLNHQLRCAQGFLFSYI